MPTLISHLTDRDRDDLAVALFLSAVDEPSAFRARRLARLLGVLDLYDAHVKQKPPKPVPK